jgi:hypothetical protein
VLINRFSGVIKYIKKRSANIVVILKAWSFVKGLKVIRNTFKDSCSWLFKSKLIISASINSLYNGYYSATRAHRSLTDYLRPVT